MARKVKFGSNAKCVIKYTIVKVLKDGSIRFVTKIEHFPKKYVHWEDGKKAVFFESRSYAEDVCFGLNVNSYATFVMEVPDYFNEDDFINPESDKKEAKNA